MFNAWICLYNNSKFCIQFFVGGTSVGLFVLQVKYFGFGINLEGDNSVKNSFQLLAVCRLQASPQSHKDSWSPVDDEKLR